MNILIEKTQGVDGTPCVLINDRFLIYLDDGVIYDTVAAEDIPQYVFIIRDNIDLFLEV